MFPSPIPKYIADHPTYASWFDDKLSRETLNGSEWISILLQDSKGNYVSGTATLPYPEVLASSETIPLSQKKGYILSLIYYVVLQSRLVYVGSVRIRLSQRKLGETPVDVKVAKLILPYKSVANALSNRSKRLLFQETLRRRAGWSSSAPTRPNENVQTPFRRLIEGADTSGVYHLVSDVTTNRQTSSRTWTGVRTPNFRRKKVEGQLPVNPHTVRIVEEKGGTCIFHTTRSSDPLYYDFELCHQSQYYALPGAPVHSASASSKAFARLAKKVGTIEGNLAQDLVQYKQTVNMIADHATRITRAYGAVRHGHFDHAMSILYHPAQSKYSRGKPTSIKDSTANNWLALQYGWKPLINDIHEAIELIKAQNKNDEGSLQKVVASSTVKSETSSDFDIWGTPGYKAGTVDTVTKSTARYYLMYKQSSTLTNYLQQTGFTNAPNLAWEVLPYSFVVDWFLPIGPWLETLSLWQGKQFVTGGLTKFTRSYSYHRIDYDTDIAGSAFHVRGRGEYIRRDVLFDRTVLTDFPRKELPRLKNPLSITHALNAVALLVVGLKKSSKIRD